VKDAQVYNLKAREVSKFKVTCPSCKREWLAMRSKNVSLAGPSSLIGDDKKSIFAKFEYKAHCFKCKTNFTFKLVVDYRLE